MDKINEFVDRAIDHSEDILRHAPRYSSASRDECERMRAGHEIGAKDHPALKRLRKYVRKFDPRHQH